MVINCRVLDRYAVGLLLSLCGGLSQGANVDACAGIAAATVAELKAGAATWGPDDEQLARRAAGAACVKALSAAVTAPLPALTEERLDAPVGAAGRDPLGDDGNSVAAASASELDDGDEAEDEREDEEEKSGLFSGFKLNDVSGSPGKKPYQRKKRNAED